MFFPFDFRGLLCHVYLSRKENLVEIRGNLGIFLLFVLHVKRGFKRLLALFL